MRRKPQPQLARVEKALATAQKRVGTAFVFQVQQMQVAEDDVSVLAIGRTERGEEDALSFAIGVNVDAVAELKQADLVKIAGHEVIHAVLWKLVEMISRGVSETQAERIHHEFESATYLLQRALFGDL